jgi:hypothetical protein
MLPATRKLFSAFLVIVTLYSYFASIVLYLLGAALPFNLLFLGAILKEGINLAFVGYVGYKFRPMPVNPYFIVEEEDVVHLKPLKKNEEGEEGEVSAAVPVVCHG